MQTIREPKNIKINNAGYIISKAAINCLLLQILENNDSGWIYGGEATKCKHYRVCNGITVKLSFYCWILKCCFENMPKEESSIRDWERIIKM